MDAIKNAAMTIHWWTYLFPPAWLAGFVKLSLFSGLSTPVYRLALMGLVIPVAGMMVIIRLLSKGFGNLLSEGSEEETKTGKVTGRRFGFKARFYKLFCISGLEEAGWKLAMATTRRDRKFKQAVYPSFGFFLVFLFMILKPNLSDLSGSLEKLAHSNSYLMLIVFSYFFTTGMTQLPFTDNPDAAWIYQALPVRKKRHILTGAVKALLFKFYAPLYLILATFAVLIWGPRVLPALILGFLTVILITILTLIIQKMGLPFTQPRELIGKGTNMLKTLLSFFLMIVAAGLIFLTTRIPSWVTLLICGLAIGAITLSYSKLREEVT